MGRRLPLELELGDLNGSWRSRDRRLGNNGGNEKSSGEGSARLKKNEMGVNNNESNNANESKFCHFHCSTNTC